MPGVSASTSFPAADTRSTAKTRAGREPALSCVHRERDDAIEWDHRSTATSPKARDDLY